MTPEQQLAKMEKEVSSLSGKVDTILQLVQKMDVGLYGDEKNKHTGVIEKQILLEQEIESLKEKIEVLNKRNSEQELAYKTKKSFKDELIEYAKELGKWIINGVVVYLVIKGIVSPEALLKH